MAKKSNKTEHVMKLITKDKPESPEKVNSPDVETTLSPSPVNELSMKTKLKIEIEPEIEVKDQSHSDDSGQTILELVKELAPEMPDGTPYENMNDVLRPDIFGYTGRPGKKEETLEDVRASIRLDEEKRMKKIEFEGQLFGYNNNLINLTELLTKELMPSIMEKMSVCNCDTCATNIMALALNSLPPKYVTTDAGKQYSQLELFKSQSELDVVQAITKACLRVKSMPRHGDTEAAKKL